MLRTLAHVAVLVLMLMITDRVSAATAGYIIYPKTSITAQQSNTLYDEIKARADQGKVYVSKRAGIAVPTFFTADLTASGAAEIGALEPLVQDIHIEAVAVDFEDESSIYLNDTLSSVSTYATQSDAPYDLRMLSQPKGSKSLDQFPNYVYPSGPYEQTFIYHAENGINGAHLDFQGRPVEWVYTGRAIDMGMNTETEAASSKGHSTCTASKAAGLLYGAAKHATLVVVKAPDSREGSMGELLGTIIDHIGANGRRGNSVITISWTSKELFSQATLQRKTWWQIAQKNLRDLSSYYVPVFCSAGNKATTQTVKSNTVPAALLSKGINRLIPIANCDETGARYPTSQVALVDDWQLYAPGVAIKCADYLSATDVQTKTGTSFSAPLVAGVVAEMLAYGQIYHSSINNYLTRVVSWARPGRDERVIWNLVDATHNPPTGVTTNAGLSNLTLPSLSNLTLPSLNLTLVQ